MSKKSFPFHDIARLRALACVAVASVHVGTNWLPGTGLGELVLNQLARFGTPALLFISAFLLASKKETSEFKTRPFLMARLKYIALPYLFVSLYYLAKLVQGGQSRLIPWQLLSGGPGHLYFVPLIFQFYGIFILFSHWGREHEAAFWRRLFAPAVWLALTYSVAFIAMDVPMERWQWLFPLWGPFFVLGGLFATDREGLTARWHRLRLGRYLVPALLLALLVGEAVLLNGVTVSYARHEALTASRGPLAILFSLAFIVWFMCEPWAKRTAGRLTWLISSRSFGIYLIHPIVGQVLWNHVPGTHTLPRTLSFMLVFGLSMAIVALLQQVPAGRFLVGKPGPLGQVPPLKGLPAAGEAQVGLGHIDAHRQDEGIGARLANPDVA